VANANPKWESMGETGTAYFLPGLKVGRYWVKKRVIKETELCLKSLG
jgi:hypothetical protein